MHSTHHREQAFVVFSLLFLFLWACWDVWPAEDAVILYEYSKNLAHKGVITYSTSLLPIEGATDFLWMILISLGSFLRANEFIVAEILSFLSVCGLFWLLLARGISPLGFMLSLILTPYFYATLFGFSALFFTFFYVLALLLVNRSVRYFYLSLLILCLLRPDGVVWSLGLIAYRVFHEKIIAVRPLCVFFILPYALYWIARTLYFGEFWPLPFIVKGFHHDQSSLFYTYSLICIILVAQPIFFSLFFFNHKQKLLRDACLLFMIPCFFYGMMRLEQNVGNRLLAPMFWGWLFHLGQQPSKRILNQSLGVWFFIFCSAIYSCFITAYTASSLLKSYQNNVYLLAKKIDTLPKGRMLVSEAGRLAYYTHWQVEDSWGLNTPYYAHHFLDDADLKRGHYDLIVTHCDLTLLHDTHLYTHFSEKTWEHQAHLFISYLRAEQYDIYLVPYYWHKQNAQKKDEQVRCMRYDLYGISKSFHHYDALRQMLVDHGGLPYSSALSIEEDKVCI